MKKEELITYLLRPDIEDYLVNLKEGADEDDAYEFAHDVLDPMTRWIIESFNNEHLYTRMDIDFPSNPYLDGCDEDHTFSIYVTVDRADENDDESEDTASEITKVVIDGEEYPLDSIDIENLLYFAKDRCYDGWMPSIWSDGHIAQHEG